MGEHLYSHSPVGPTSSSAAVPPTVDLANAVSQPTLPVYAATSSTALPVYNSVISSNVIQAAPQLKPIDVYTDDPSLVYKPVEDLIGGQFSTTAFVGSIAEGVSDELIQRILESCGRVMKWKRPLEPSGKFKKFGFCDFMHADGLSRAMRILPLLQIKDSQLAVKVDDNTRSNLTRYDEAMKKYVATRPHIPDHTAFDQVARENITELIKAKNLAFFWNDPNAPPLPRISVPQSIEPTNAPPHPQPNAQEIERDLENRRRAKRELERLVDQERERKDALYRDRLRRWRAKEEGIKKDYLRFDEDERKEKSRQEALKKDHENLIHLHMNYANFIGKELFFTDRKAWRSERARVLAKEHGMYGEADVEHIKNELEKILSLSLFEDRLYIPSLIKSSDRPIRPPRISDDQGELDRRGVLAYPSSILKQRMKGELPEALSLDELLASGLPTEEAQVKFNAQQKTRLELLAKVIPVDKEDVFHYPIFWPILEEHDAPTFYTDILPKWLSKKIPEILAESKRSEFSPMIEAILYSIKMNKNPFKLVNELIFLLEGGGKPDSGKKTADGEDHAEKATIFVLKLWRFLILESERLLLSREN